MDLAIMVLHMLAAVGIVGLVLMQHGKGADVGAAFGSGSAGSVFGSAGSANFLSRMTAVLAVVFFLTSIGLSYMGSRKSVNKGVMGNAPATQPADKVPGAKDAPVAKGAEKAADKAAPAAEKKDDKGDKGSKAGDVPK